MAHKTQGTKTNYPTDVSDEEWDFCAPYLTLMKEDAPQREYSMRALFNAVRYMVRAGCPWRMIPNDLPPWFTVHQQTQRWIKAGRFEAMAHVLRFGWVFAPRSHSSAAASSSSSQTAGPLQKSGRSMRAMFSKCRTRWTALPSSRCSAVCGRARS